MGESGEDKALSRTINKHQTTTATVKKRWTRSVRFKVLVLSPCQFTEDVLINSSTPRLGVLWLGCTPLPQVGYQAVFSLSVGN